MDLIDLQKDPQPIDSEEMYDQPMYSYGLCISLGREELEKLGIEKLPEAGSEMMIKAFRKRRTEGCNAGRQKKSCCQTDYVKR